MKKILTLIFLFFLSSVALGQEGSFERDDCATITAPVATKTWCKAKTTVGVFTAGREYRWTGAAWEDSGTHIFNIGPNYCADAGSTDTYTCTLTPALAAYTDGMVIIFKPNTNNTGVATLNINALGAKTVKKSDGITNPDNNELVAGRRYTLYYDGTVFRMHQDRDTAGATPTLDQVFDQGKVIDGANSFANAERVTDASGDGTVRYTDATDGPVFTCVVGGVENDCDKVTKLNSGKEWAVSDSAGNRKIKVTNTDPDTFNLLERGTDPTTPATGRWGLYFKSYGLHVKDDAGNVAGPLTANGVPAVTYTPPVNADFSWVNQGSATITASASGDYLFAPAQGVTHDLHARIKTAPATPYTVTINAIPNYVVKSGQLHGILFRESGTSKLIQLAFTSCGAGEFGCLLVIKWTDTATISTTADSANLIQIPRFVRMADNGTNISFSFSHDGVNFISLFSEVRGTFFTTGPNQIGYGVNPTNDGTPNRDGGLMVVSWKQE